MEKKEPSAWEESRNEDIEAFNDIWVSTMQRVLSISYVDKVADNFRLDKTKQSAAAMAYQQKTHEILKTFRQRLRALTDKFGLATAMREATQALDFNLLIAELTHSPDPAFTEKEL